jgi:hypothetical protein
MMNFTETTPAGVVFFYPFSFPIKTHNLSNHLFFRQIAFAILSLFLPLTK